MTNNDRRVIAIVLLALLHAISYLVSTYSDDELKKIKLQELANRLEDANREVHEWGRPK